MREAEREESVVLVSGGIDSAVALFWAVEQGGRVTALTFDYHGRPPREAEATRAVARSAGVDDVRVVPLPWMRELADTPPSEIRNARLVRAPQGYIPARNLAFYAIATHFGELVGATRIVGGHHGRDRERFPDAAPAFFDALARAANAGLLSPGARRLEIATPLAGLDKAGVLELGFRLRVPYESTWSCYEADLARPCGSCVSCAERADAFAVVGRPDPLLA